MLLIGSSEHFVEEEVPGAFFELPFFEVPVLTVARRCCCCCCCWSLPFVVAAFVVGDDDDDDVKVGVGSPKFSLFFHVEEPEAEAVEQRPFLSHLIASLEFLSSEFGTDEVVLTGDDDVQLLVPLTIFRGLLEIFFVALLNNRLNFGTFCCLTDPDLLGEEGTEATTRLTITFLLEVELLLGEGCADWNDRGWTRR